MLRRNRAGSPPWLDETIRRMLDYLVAILPPDGEVPLLKDTARDAAPRPEDLLAAGALYLSEPEYKRVGEFGLYPFLLFGRPGGDRYGRWPTCPSPRKPAALRGADHYVMRDDARGDFLILDAGKPCPDYLPAHAHAELLVSGERVIVDSGVYEYTAGSWRDFFRSTRAHNTVEVAGTDQSEVWDSFRVARRARPGAAIWIEGEDWILFQGSHDGYCRLRPQVTHRRTVAWLRDRLWIIVDELQGSGPIKAASHLHLRPDCSLEAVEERGLRIRGPRIPLSITPFGHQRCSILRGQMDPFIQGWYSEAFGLRLPNTVLTLHLDGSMPLCFGYVIFKDTPGKASLHAAPDANEVHVVQAERACTLRIHPEGAPVLLPK
jgi:hypothetical protein